MQKKSATRHSRISTARQFLSLSTSPQCRGKGLLTMGGLTWEFWAKPTPLSRNYKIRIVYRLGDAPYVYVEKPDLNILSEGRKLPHVYEQKPTRLCLYLPGTGEWSSDKWLTKTIVPWTILWLFYFEDWSATNEWKGGGIHLEPRNEKRKKNSDN